MKSAMKTLFLMFVAIVMLPLRIPASAQRPMTPLPPDNVAGHWIISSPNGKGVMETKTIDVQQNGGLISGFFRGPRQSGSLDGIVSVHHIVFRTNTRNPLTFRGRVYGNTIQGICNVRGQATLFNAWRQAP